MSAYHRRVVRGIECTGDAIVGICKSLLFPYWVIGYFAERMGRK
jgi:hypothetical protein